MSGIQLRRTWAQLLRWFGWKVLMVAGAFLAALVATALAAFSLAMTFGSNDPRPEPWSTIVFFVVFFGLLGWSILRDVRRARQARAGGAAC